MNGNDERETIIADGTVMKGSVNSDCPVTVSGKIDGELEAPTLHITQSGSVNGQILVEKINSEGEISGEIEAQEVILSGKVRDKTSIKAKTLEVKLNAQDPDVLNLTFGECSIDVGNEPENTPEVIDEEDVVE